MYVGCSCFTTPRMPQTSSYIWPLLTPLHNMIFMAWSLHDVISTSLWWAIYIYMHIKNKKIKKHTPTYKFEKVKTSCSEFKLSFLKLGWRSPKFWKNFLKEFKSGSSSWSKKVQRLKEFFEKFQVGFLNYCPLYIYIYKCI